MVEPSSLTYLISGSSPGSHSEVDNADLIFWLGTGWCEELGTGETAKGGDGRGKLNLFSSVICCQHDGSEFTGCWDRCLLNHDRRKFRGRQKRGLAHGAGGGQSALPPHSPGLTPTEPSTRPGNVCMGSVRGSQ